MSRNPSRYRDTGIEGEWQPGSRKRVLRKKEYLDAVIAGYGQNYEPLTFFFCACVEGRLEELEE